VDWVKRTIDRTSSPTGPRLLIGQLHLGLAGAPFAGGGRRAGGPVPPDQGEAALREALSAPASRGRGAAATLLEERGRGDIAATRGGAPARTRRAAPC
jgi:hypothetical protein